MSRCASCPVAAGKPCLGEDHPASFAHFCRWAADGEPSGVGMVVLRSELGFTPPPPAPPQAAVAPPAPGIPLAGDVLEAALKRLGADRLAKWYEKMTGKGCGCGARREAMNRADAALRRFLSR